MGLTGGLVPSGRGSPNAENPEVNKSKSPSLS